MTRLNTPLKSIKLNKILAVLIAGSLLWLTTACGRPDTTQLSEGGSYSSRKGQHTELYDTIQKKADGPNQYNDTDPRLDASRSDRKAQQLIDRARSNTRKVNSPGEFARSYQEGKPLNERVKDLTKDVGQSVQDVTEDVSKGTQRGVQNLRQNAQNATDRVTEGAKQGVQSVRQGAQNATDRVTNVGERALDRS
jgi:hypothetical protein